MTKKKNVYTAEFKAEAVKMTKDQGVAKTAVDLGVSPISLRNWSKKIESNQSSKSSSLNEAQREIKRLQKENQYLKKINEVLKKSTAIFSQGELPPSK
jgi:transposase